MLFLFLAIVSGIGFLASVACHVLGWLRINPPGGKRVFALHVIILALWFVLIFSARNNNSSGQGRRTLGPMLETVPSWLRSGIFILFIYAIAHFAFFIFQTRGKRTDNFPLYVQVRGFSGHWMMFYAVATIGFFALYRLGQP